MKKLLIGIVLMLVLAGCTESTVSKVDNESGAAASDTADEPVGPEIFALGDTVQFDDLHITLNGVRADAGDDFLKPDKGKYLVFDLTIENKGTEAEAVSTMLQMSVADADAFSYDMALYTKGNGSLDGEVPAGRKVRGEVAFDVPDSDYYEFVFEDPFTNGQAIWKVDAGQVTE